jgi:cytidyltransferase-like protein
VVLAAGTFDLLHPGHVAYLDACKRQGEHLVVCVAGDRRVRRRKGPGRPLLRARVRAHLVLALKPVDTVFVSDARPFAERTLRALRPDVIVTTEDEPTPRAKASFITAFRRAHPEIRLHLMKRRESPVPAFSTSHVLAQLKRRPAAAD